MDHQHDHLLRQLLNTQILRLYKPSHSNSDFYESLEIYILQPSYSYRTEG